MSTKRKSIELSKNLTFSRNYQKINPQKKIFSCSLLSLMISTLMVQNALAATGTELNNKPVANFDKIIVIAEKSDEATEATEDIVSAKDISDHQIESQQDLVRNNTEISVAEVGRYGNKGYTIRGVDGNRVAMTLDGVNLPDQQINQIFSPYGYMYEGRFNPDVELLSEVRLQVGADSFTSGSGALGGAVNYKTKDPMDLIKPGNQLGGYAKVGYSDKNEEFKTAVGLAGRNDKIEALINYVYRDGHELKNHRMLDFNKDKLDPSYDFERDPDYRMSQEGYIDNQAAILPDPRHYDSHATLAKAYWHVNDEHRVGVQGTYQYRQDKTNNYANHLSTSGGKRIGYDESELTSYGINYRYLPLDSRVIDEIKADLTYQEVVGVANTYIYKDETNELEGNKYRPQYDTIKQLNVEGIALPIETEHFGTHNISSKAKVVKADYELILQEWEKLIGRDLLGFGFIGPAVKKDIVSVALSDKIDITDRFSTTLGVRYDDYTYKPYMTEYGKAGLLGASDFYPVKIAYKNGDFDKDQHMNNVGGLLAFNYQVTPNWQTGYKLSTGFMAPSTSQMYSAFEILGNNLTPNVHLKPEKSLNHELTLKGNFDTFSVNATGFYTDYSDFIDTVYYQNEEPRCYTDNGTPICTPFIVNYISAQNIGKAKTYGVNLGGAWDLSDKANTQGRVRLNANLSYAKDSTDKGINLLATQPLNALMGLDYESANQDYQLHANLNYLGRKKAEDAKVTNFVFQGHDKKSLEVIEPYEHIDKSKSAFVFDVYGSKKLGNGFILAGGIYNLFDKEYVPWDSLRTLADLNVNSMVDDKGVGIERYTAPGRNYKIGLTYEF